MKHTIEEYQDSLNEIRFYAIDTLVNAEFEQRALYRSADQLQELIDNQNPIGVLHTHPLKQFGVCPTCDANVNIDKNTRFCGKCGQALKWSKNEKTD
jgi:NADH pyrophosphatase NudC (nudix superfamily)